MSTAIVPVMPQGGAELYRTSTDAAGLCKAIVIETAISIQGRKYVKVEGWQAIALAHGCVASADSVERVDNPECAGYRATGKVIRADTGQVLATGEGFVGDDEGAWNKRPVYARRAMAQTRAISRACRAAFAHVVVMMNAGLSTTPAEEVPDEGFNDAPRRKAPPARSATVETTTADPEVMTIPFGKNKGVPINDEQKITVEGLNWYLKAFRKDLADPAKSQYAERTQRQVACVEAELARRKVTPAEMPPPAEDDVNF